MTDVFDAMKAHVDAITEHQVACEIEGKANAELESARKTYSYSCRAASDLKKKRDEADRTLCNAIFNARKATPKTGEWTTYAARRKRSRVAHQRPALTARWSRLNSKYS